MARGRGTSPQGWHGRLDPRRLRDRRTRKPCQSPSALRQGLRELGLVEGQNLTIDFRFAEGSEERLPILAAELVALPLSAIVATTTQGTRALEQTGTSIPIVFTGLQDPVAAGLIDTL